MKKTIPLMIMLTSLSSPLFAFESGDWLVRLRAIDIDPMASSSEINAPALGGYVPGSEVTVNNVVVPELDFTYMVTRNIGLELILATSKHTVTASGTASSLGDVLTTWVLPPTLTVQYHFLPESTFQPYIGAGINYTLFYNQDLDSSFSASGDSVHLSHSFGAAGQVGMDVLFSEDWFANIDVKYVDMGTSATIHHSAAGNIWVDDVDINPWVFGIGVGRRF